MTISQQFMHTHFNEIPIVEELLHFQNVTLFGFF